MCIRVPLEDPLTQDVHKRWFFIGTDLFILFLPLVKDTVFLVVSAGMTVGTDRDKIIGPVCPTIATVTDMMGPQDLIPGLATYLAGIVIPCKYKIPYIIIAISLSMLIINTLDFRIDHFSSIKFPDFDMKTRGRYQQTEYIDPPESMPDTVFQTWRKPCIRTFPVQKSRFSVSGLPVPTAPAVDASGIQVGFYILPEFHFAFEQDLIFRPDSDPNVFGTGINAYRTVLLCFACRIVQLDRKWMILTDPGLTSL